MRKNDEGANVKKLAGLAPLKAEGRRERKIVVGMERGLGTCRIVRGKGEEDQR